MRKYGIKGNIFLPTKYIDEQDVHFMSWAQLKELCENKEFSVAGHTHTHVDIRTLAPEAMLEEVNKSNDLIFQNLGIRTKSFCMPYGKYDVKSIRRLKENSDYKFIYASFYGHTNEKERAKHVIPRIGVSNDDTLEVFAKKIEGRLNWKGIVQRIRLMISNWKGERIIQYDIE